MLRKLMGTVVVLSVVAVVLFVQAAPKGLIDQFTAAQPGAQWIGQDTGPIGGSLKASVEQFFAQIKVSGSDLAYILSTLLVLSTSSIAVYALGLVLCALGRKNALIVLIGVVIIIAVACR
jgi:hypothetical protein